MIFERVKTISKIATLAGISIIGSIQASYKDAPDLEPYPLTEKLINELLTKKEKQSISKFSLKGLELSTSFKNDRIGITVHTDQKLNLWRGRPMDLSSSHLGKMKILIQSVMNNKGKNIYDKSKEYHWSSTAIIYHRGDGVFNGGRIVNYIDTPKENIKSLSGTIELSLPIGIKKYTLFRGKNNNFKKIEKENKDIKDIFLNKDGLKIIHPKSCPDFIATIMVFNKSSKRVNIGSAGSAGSNRDNHYFYFSQAGPQSKILLFIPEKFKKISIPFSIIFNK